MTDTTTGTTHPTPDRGSYVEHERGPAVRFERHYPFPVERVWRAVTDPAELRAWFPSPEVTFEARVGGTITLAGDPYQAEAMTGRVLAWDPPHVFGFAVLVAVNVFYLLAVDRLGFVIVGTVYLAALMWVLRVKPWNALALGLVLTLLVHGAFYKLLKVPLPWGVLQGVAW